MLDTLFSSEIPGRTSPLLVLVFGKEPAKLFLPNRPPIKLFRDDDEGLPVLLTLSDPILLVLEEDLLSRWEAGVRISEFLR